MLTVLPVSKLIYYVHIVDLRTHFGILYYHASFFVANLLHNKMIFFMQLLIYKYYTK